MTRNEWNGIESNRGVEKRDGYWWETVNQSVMTFHSHKMVVDANQSMNLYWNESILE